MRLGGTNLPTQLHNSRTRISRFAKRFLTKREILHSPGCVEKAWERALILRDAYRIWNCALIPFFPKFSQFDQLTHVTGNVKLQSLSKVLGLLFFLLPPFFLSLSLPWPNVELCAQFVSCYIAKLNRGQGYLAKGKIPSSSHYTCKPFYWTRRGIFRGLPPKPFSLLFYQTGWRKVRRTFMFI